jgi:transposase
MRAYSLDLRERVLSAALRRDHTILEAVRLFGVSAAFVNRVLPLHRSRSGHRPAAAKNDATLGELREHPARRARVSVSEATVSRALTKLGLPRKKKHEGGGEQQL